MADIVENDTQSISSDGEETENDEIESDSGTHESSIDSEGNYISPNTKRLNQAEKNLNELKPQNRDELKMKLRQKLMLSSTRRLSRYGQSNKLDMMSEQMKAKQAEIEEETQKKREKNREKKKKYLQKKKEQKAAVMEITSPAFSV